jgi:hypothetical protein
MTREKCTSDADQGLDLIKEIYTIAPLRNAHPEVRKCVRLSLFSPASWR